jgi:uncharacterized damage-inducible protein DinB
MDRQKKDLVDRIGKFNSEVMAFVEKCSDEDWKKVCAAEDWTVGVVARHIGAGHYSAIGLADMIVQGKKLPELSLDQVVSMANQHATEHADCTREEVLQILEKTSQELQDYITRLDDADLDRTAHLVLIGKEISARRFLEMVVLQSGGGHFASMKAAVDAT